MQPSRDRLIQAAVEPHEVPTGAERQPVKVDAGHQPERRLPGRLSESQFAEEDLNHRALRTLGMSAPRSGYNGANRILRPRSG